MAISWISVLAKLRSSGVVVTPNFRLGPIWSTVCGVEVLSPPSGPMSARQVDMSPLARRNVVCIRTHLHTFLTYTAPLHGKENKHVSSTKTCHDTAGLIVVVIVVHITSVSSSSQQKQLEVRLLVSFVTCLRFGVPGIVVSLSLFSVVWFVVVLPLR